MNRERHIDIWIQLLLFTNTYDDWINSDNSKNAHITWYITNKNYENKDLLLSLLNSQEKSNLIILLELLKNNERIDNDTRE